MRWFACPICRAIAKDRALCAYCAEHLYRRREPVTRDLGVYHVRSLFAWRRDDWLGLRWWAMALKAKEHDAFWREPATWALDALGPLADGTLIVPVPSTRPLNHARGFARALTERSRATFADVLRARSARHQRRLGRDQRRARRFDLDVTQAFPGGRVIIVDDVVTSGATVEAAFRALGQPPGAEAWCLMDRRPRGE